MASNTKGDQSNKAADDRAATDHTRCVECWATHPKHRGYCSWSVGSRAAGLNIVAPDYRNEKDEKIELDGGYVGVNRHVADVWGVQNTKKQTTQANHQDATAGTKASEDPDWVMVEGDWVEI